MKKNQFRVCEETSERREDVYGSKTEFPGHP